VAISGDLLGDRYRLDDRIAGGGMGDVWLGTDTVLGRRVAVKMLHARQAGDALFQARFRHEARSMAALHHPGVAQVYDYGEIGDHDGAYLVMAHVDGQPLDERIAAAGRLDPDETVSIVAQAARALHAAHTAGIIHRDVKPGNLIVQPDGTVVLVDFGVARSAESVDLTGVGEVVGTVLYIAPEQVSKQSIGPATDIYALGAVAYQCLAGRPPFLGDNPVTVAMHHLSDDPPPLPADVPPPVRDLVTTAMAKDPADRFPTAAAMADAADAIAANSRAAGANPVGALAVRAPAVAAPVGETRSTDETRTMVAPPALRARWGDRRARLGWAVLLVAFVMLGVILTSTTPGGLGPDSTPPASPQIPAPDSVGGTQGGGPGASPDGTGQPSPNGATPGAPGPGSPGTTPSTPEPEPEPSEPAPTTGAPTQGPSSNPDPTATDTQPAASPSAPAQDPSEKGAPPR
jgi:serine/threonine-protein kinase